MDTKINNRNIQSLVRSLSKGDILLTHRLQRPEGQWDRYRKSLLIDTLLRHMPVNPTYVEKVETEPNKTTTLYTIDGVQRMSTIRDYLDDKFSLTKDLYAVNIRGTEYEISGKKFSQLDEDVQEELKDAEISIVTLSDCTDEDIVEVFKRMNLGKPLSNKHMRVVYESEDFREQITTLASHEFIKQFMSNANKKNGTLTDVIIETIMLLEADKTGESISFRTKDIDKFIVNESENIDPLVFDRIGRLFDSLKDRFDKKITMPVTSIPMMFACGCNVESIDEFVGIVNNFVDGYRDNVEYKQYCQSGTGHAENVMARYNYWKNITLNV